MSRPIAQIEERSLLGIGLALIAYVLFVTTDSLAKWLGLAGYSVLQIMFVRYAVHLVLTTTLSLRLQGPSFLRTRLPWFELLRAAALLGTSVFNFTAVRYLPLTVTGAIGFTVPFIITILSVLFLREVVGWRRWTAIAVGFVGVLIIVRPGTELFNPATLLSLCGAICSAIYALVTRRLAGIDSTGTQQFYGAALPTLALAPFALFAWQWPASALDWTVLLFIGLVGFTSHQAMTIAHRFAPASTLAPFGYTQIIFFAVSSWVVFNQPPDVWLYLGAPIVIASGLYIWLRERRLSKPVTPVVEER
jgi:drug/metabolite transporter (DMT)-like permease